MLFGNGRKRWVSESVACVINMISASTEHGRNTWLLVLTRRWPRSGTGKPTFLGEGGRER